jgi:hypothetical protein
MVAVKESGNILQHILLRLITYNLSLELPYFFILSWSCEFSSLTPANIRLESSNIAIKICLHTSHLAYWDLFAESRGTLLGNGALKVPPWQTWHHETMKQLRGTVLSMRSAVNATLCCDKWTARRGVFYGVRPEVISGELKHSQKWTRMEAGSNTSTVTLRVVEGDEKGCLESETVKYGHESYGTLTRKWLRWPSSNCKRQIRPLVREGATNQQTRNCQTIIKIWS